MTGQATTASTTPTSARINLWWIASVVLVVAAIGISGYLAYTEFTKGNVACVEGPGFDCGLVQSSSYSKILGIPVAYLGLAANLGVLALLLLEPRIAILRQWGPVVLFGVLLIGLLFSGWLIYVQAVLLKAFCVWCLAHEVVYGLLFAAGTVRLVQWLGAEELEEDAGQAA